MFFNTFRNIHWIKESDSYSRFYHLFLMFIYLFFVCKFNRICNKCGLIPLLLRTLNAPYQKQVYLKLIFIKYSEVKIKYIY